MADIHVIAAVAAEHGGAVDRRYRQRAAPQSQVLCPRQAARRLDAAALGGGGGGGQRGVEIGDAGHDAIGRRGGGFDIRPFHQVAIDGDGAQPVVVMGAAIVALVGIERDHRVIEHPVAIGIAIADRQDLGGVPLDHQPVALGAGIIHHHIIAQGVDPVVVQLVILARHAVPVDAAIVVGVLLDIAFLGVDQRLEIEDVGALAAGQRIVGRHRLVRVELAIGQLVQRVALVAVGVEIDRPLAPVGAADQQVVAVAAEQPVLALAAIQDVIAGAAQQPVIARAALQHVGAAAALDHVVAAAAIQPVRRLAAAQLVIRPALGNHLQRLHQVAMGADAIIGQDLLQRVRAVMQLAEDRRQIGHCRLHPGAHRQRRVDLGGQRLHIGFAQLLVEDPEIADAALEQRMRRVAVAVAPGAAAAHHQRVGIGRDALLELRLGGNQRAVQPDHQPVLAEAQRELIGGLRLQHQVGHLEIFGGTGAVLRHHQGAVLDPDGEIPGAAAIAVLGHQRIVPRQAVQCKAQRDRRVRQCQRGLMRDVQVIPRRAGQFAGSGGGKNRCGGSHDAIPRYIFSRILDSKRGNTVALRARPARRFRNWQKFAKITLTPCPMVINARGRGRRVQPRGEFAVRIWPVGAHSRRNCNAGVTHAIPAPAGFPRAWPPPEGCGPRQFLRDLPLISRAPPFRHIRRINRAGSAGCRKTHTEESRHGQRP